MSSQSEPVLTVLHYLFTHSGDRIVAHCLDLDLVTSGADMQKAEESLNATVLTQIASCFTAGNFAQLRFKAPLKYWQALEDAKKLDTVHLDVEVPPVVLPVTRSVALPVVRAERVMEMCAA